MPFVREPGVLPGEPAGIWCYSDLPTLASPRPGELSRHTDLPAAGATCSAGWRCGVCDSRSPAGANLPRAVRKALAPTLERERAPGAAVAWWRLAPAPARAHGVTLNVSPFRALIRCRGWSRADAGRVATPASSAAGSLSETRRGSPPCLCRDPFRVTDGSISCIPPARVFGPMRCPSDLPADRNEPLVLDRFLDSGPSTEFASLGLGRIAANGRGLSADRGACRARRGRLVITRMTLPGLPSAASPVRAQTTWRTPPPPSPSPPAPASTSVTSATPRGRIEILRRLASALPPPL
jgi:hypothetical protein